ncbi:MAG TPA: hypothetical protein VGB68_00895, partial [Pyrinomonadaceae bacterium]
MAKLQRIVSVTDFNLKQLEKQSPDKTLHAQFLLTAYYASPENLTATTNPQQPNGTAPTTPGQPVAPNAQTPPAPVAK